MYKNENNRKSTLEYFGTFPGVLFIVLPVLILLLIFTCQVLIADDTVVLDKSVDLPKTVAGGAQVVRESAQSPETSAEEEDKPEEELEKTIDNTEQEIDKNDWRLILVNSWNLFPNDYEMSLHYLNNGHAIDERCYPDLQEMMDDCRAAGLSPLICSSYRAFDTQEYLFNQELNRLVYQGYSYEEAEAEAKTSVAFPGTSEHHTGLAVDIVDVDNQILYEAQEDTPVQQWLMENSWKYGFILRYPENKSDVTGIIYEPWHYRYVGREHAERIYTQDLCLEEYLESSYE